MVKINVRDTDGPVISSSTSSEAKDGISGASECSWRSALFWRVTTVGGGAEVVDDEGSHVVSGILRAEEFSRVSAAAVGPGEVAESCKISVVV